MRTVSTATIFIRGISQSGAGWCPTVASRLPHPRFKFITSEATVKVFKIEILPLHIKNNLLESRIWTQLLIRDWRRATLFNSFVRKILDCTLRRSLMFMGCEWTRRVYFLTANAWAAKWYLAIFLKIKSWVCVQSNSNSILIKFWQISSLLGWNLAKNIQNCEFSFA